MAHAMLCRDDALLRAFDHGEGPAVVFQHGLGGDEAQAAQTFPAAPGCRRLTLECRGHGGSSLGSRRPFSFAMFADDVLAATDRAGIERFVACGISMGAGLALCLACRHPDRVTGLLLVRPAWTFGMAPMNLWPIAEVAAIPGAAFVEVPPKSLDSSRHFAEAQAKITAFLHAHFNIRSVVPS